MSDRRLLEIQQTLLPHPDFRGNVWKYSEIHRRTSEGCWSAESADILGSLCEAGERLCHVATRFPDEPLDKWLAAGRFTQLACWADEFRVKHGEQTRPYRVFNALTHCGNSCQKLREHLREIADSRGNIMRLELNPGFLQIAAYVNEAWRSAIDDRTEHILALVELFCDECSKLYHLIEDARRWQNEQSRRPRRR